jgi:DNA invertase Pin-like site-specific DNA recombinase
MVGSAGAGNGAVAATSPVRLGWCQSACQQLEAAFDYVREGDTFAVTKLDRLARSVGDLLVIVARLEAKKVSLRVLSISGSQALDTSTSTGRLMLAVIGAVGQA